MSKGLIKGGKITKRKKGADDADAKNGKESGKEDINLQTLKMLLDTQQKTFEMVLGSAAKGRNALTEEEMLDQEDLK